MQRVQCGVDLVDAFADVLERRLRRRAGFCGAPSRPLLAGVASCRLPWPPRLVTTQTRAASTPWMARICASTAGSMGAVEVDQRVGELAARLVQQVRDVELRGRQTGRDLADHVRHVLVGDGDAVAAACAAGPPPGKFTELRTLPFSRKSRSVSATMIAQFSSASSVEAPRCGSATTCGWSFDARWSGSRRRRRDSWPLSSAASTAASSTIRAREKFRITPPRGISRRRASLTRLPRRVVERHVHGDDVGAREQVVED